MLRISDNMWGSDVINPLNTCDKQHTELSILDLFVFVILLMLLGGKICSKFLL